jgi:hypothetical protein
MSGNLDEGSIKRSYARELAAEAFALRAGVRPRRKPANEEARLRWARAGRSAKLIANGGNDQLYGMGVEQAHARTSALQHALPRVQYLCTLHEADHRVDEAHFLRTVANELETALWRCDVFFGLLQPGGDVLRYTACSSSSEMMGKELRRGTGVSFRAVDSNTTVLVGVPRAQKHNRRKEGSAREGSQHGGGGSDANDGVGEEGEEEDDEEEEQEEEEGYKRREEAAESQSATKLGRARDLPLVVAPLLPGAAGEGSTLGVLGVDHFCAELGGFFEADPEAKRQLEERQSPFRKCASNKLFDQVVKKTMLYRHPAHRFGTVEVHPHGGTDANNCAATFVQVCLLFAVCWLVGVFGLGFSCLMVLEEGERERGELLHFFLYSLFLFLNLFTRAP